MRALAALRERPPLVTTGEIENLRTRLAAAARGERFLLQGGDCAESFADCNPDAIASKLKILLQVSVVLMHGLHRPVVRVGRARLRVLARDAADTETRGGTVLPSYRGDLVNRPEFDRVARTPDPARLLEGHDRSAQTLNYIRALLDGGFADLSHADHWDIEFAQHAPLAAEYRRVVAAITASRPASDAEFFTSHEALHLHYEEAQTGWDARLGRWYLASTHFPWIGMRTSQPDSAHVEFCRGIANPVGIKVGPGFDGGALARVLETLDPDGEPGRLTVITRFGRARIRAELPRCIDAVRATGLAVVWSCDPMHGNTQLTSAGQKTRRFDDIVAELHDAFELHAAAAAPLAGVHIELTGDDVTECVGGASGLAEADLERAYRSTVDPRLNYEQALELAMAIAGTRAA